jgi:hypothetical protein
MILESKYEINEIPGFQSSRYESQDTMIILFNALESFLELFVTLVLLHLSKYFLETRDQ